MPRSVLAVPAVNISAGCARSRDITDPNTIGLGDSVIGAGLAIDTLSHTVRRDLHIARGRFANQYLRVDEQRLRLPHCIPRQRRGPRRSTCP